MLSGQELSDYIGETLVVTFEVTDNLKTTCSSRITLKNEGNECIPKGNWSIFFSHPCTVGSESPEFDVFHLNGGLFKLSPTEEFDELKPGQSIQIDLSADEPIVSRYTIFPKWYVAEDGLRPILIKSTDQEDLSFVRRFDSPRKWKKEKSDKSDPFTPQQRYERYNIKDVGHACKPVLPTPLQADLDYNQNIDLAKGDWIIVSSDPEFAEEVAKLAEHLGMKGRMNKACPSSHFIHLKKGSVENVYDSCEAYEIRIRGELPSIEITSPSCAGVFYASQTLYSLMESTSDTEKAVPLGFIRDAPRFPHRGLHLDVSRNFASADEVIKIIKVISYYKMNKFHFHLTDDEGWRIEIPGLPELTEIGGKRDHALYLEGLAVEPTLGSGPDKNSSGSGFYSVAEYCKILEAAKEHHVEVIPEIDMPGHSYAAVVAMTARYKKYKSLGKMAAAEEFMLMEPNEKTTYSSSQMYTGNTMNPCLEGTKRFVEKVVVSLKELHELIQPLTTFHVGGDEVPLGAWDSSPVCQKYYEDHKGNEEEDDDEKRVMTNELQEHFMSFVEDLCRKHELQLAVWNDGIHDPTKKQSNGRPMLVNAWRISQKSDRHNPYVLANSGYKVILSSATHTYFDHPYEPDPEENGLHWAARELETSTVFGMKPLNIYACQRKKTTFDYEKLENSSAIVGVQSQIWRELIRTDKMLEHMLFPRQLALAERAWHEANWEKENSITEAQKRDWADFVNTVGHKELRRLEKWGICYRLPPPGIKSEKGKTLVNCLYPGLKFKHRSAASEEWLPYTSLSELHREQSYEFVTSSLDGRRTSRPISHSF